MAQQVNDLTTLLLQKPRAIIDSVTWTTEVRTLKGQPFSFKDREYLFPIYRDQNKSGVVIVKARQLEVTEFAVNIALFWSTTRPHTTVLYISPRSDQVARVSKDRVNPALRFSKDNILKNTVEDNGVERKSFNNGSVIYFVSGWGSGDAARNIPADVIIFDEFQDMAAEARDTILEAASHSEVKLVYYIGSPKLAGSGFEKLWKLSDMKEWNPKEKRWEARKPGDRTTGVYFSGYHLSQEAVPWISKEDIADKKATYTEQQFINEVLGLFYAGGTVKLTIEQIMACVDRFRGFHHERIQGPAFSVMGIDWGATSYYMIMDMDGKILRMGDFRDKDLGVVEMLMEQYNVRVLVADTGFGDTEIRTLQARHGSRVVGCTYVAEKHEQIVFTKEYVLDKYKKPMTDRPVLKANRTKCLDETYDLFYKRTISIPYHKSVWKTVEPAFDHFMALFEDHKEATSRTSAMKIYERMGPDHYFHALTYANLARLYIKGLRFGNAGMQTDENRPKPEELEGLPPSVVEEAELADPDLDEFRREMWGDGRPY